MLPSFSNLAALQNLIRPVGGPPVRNPSFAPPAMNTGSGLPLQAPVEFRHPLGFPNGFQGAPGVEGGPPYRLPFLDPDMTTDPSMADPGMMGGLGNLYALNMIGQMRPSY